MKNQILIRLMVITLSVLIKCYCTAQTPISIYTPKGSVVPDTYVTPEFTQYQIDSVNAHYCNTYPNATKLADASRTYNCHGYAWHFSEGVGQPVWIGWHYVDMQSIYWTDNSYIETNYQVSPAKVRYVGKDHSAIATSQPDIFISKWRNGPLMKHYKDYCPYNNYSSLKYYIKNPFVTGSTMVCTSNCNFTVNNLYPSSTISWSVLSGLLQLISSFGNTAVFRGLTGASGPGTIQAAVTPPSGPVLNATYTVWVGTPSISNVTGPRYTQVGASTSYCATITDARANVTSYNWSLMPGIFNNYFNPGGLNCYVTWYRAGEYVLQVNASNSECGTGTTYYYPVTVGLGGYLSLSPNPASGSVQASVIKARDISTAPDSISTTAAKLVPSINQDLVSTYTVRIYNGFGILIYSTKKSGNEFTIPVNSLKDGTYIVEANDGKESYKQQLIVKH